MGSDPTAEYPPDSDEAPRHLIEVDAFRLGRTPVTNAQFAAFVRATGAPAPPSWPNAAVPPDRELHPVTYVPWNAAAAFCSWAGGSLPSEVQWERAARGGDTRAWPWGDDPPSAARAVFRREDTSPVGEHPAGAGPFGHLDLAGNAWEWTSSKYVPYPYAADDGREDGGGDGRRVLRGGAFIHGPGEIRASGRFGMLPGAVDHYVGFRLCTPPGRVANGIDLIDVPRGVVALGNDARLAGGPTRPDETPQATVWLGAFELTTTPVTNDEFAVFVRASGSSPPPHWPGGVVPAGLGLHPVTYVDRETAAAFCAWVGGRLPTEAEWEKAARGTDGRTFPWGNESPGDGHAHFAADAKRGTTSPVGMHLTGSSPYGLSDMAGNVWEWVADAYRPYPYRPDDSHDDLSSLEPGVLRGGSYASPTAAHLRCARRSASWPGRRSAHIGFRVARDTNDT